MKSFLRNMALACAILGILAFLLIKTKLVDPDQHNRYVSLLLHLQNVDSSLDENILKARNAYLMNYDPIVENTRDLKAGTAKLKDLPSFLGNNSEGRTQILQQVSDLLELVARKEMLVERFKSENSILRNSLSFFPMAAFELARKEEGSEALAQGLQLLLRDMLMYNLHSNQEILPRIQTEIEVLSALNIPGPQKIDEKDLRRTIDHATTILQYKADLDSSTAETLEVPTRPLIRKIQATYGEQYIQVVSVTNNYRLVLYLYAILLTASIAYYFLWLKNTTLALNEANLSLEKRVEERTEALNLANQKLSRQKHRLVLEVGERKAVEAALLESERNLVEAQHTGRFGNWVRDLSGELKSASAEWHRIIDVSRTELAGNFEAFLSRVCAEDRESVRAAFESLLKDHSHYSVEYRIGHPAGIERIVHEKGEIVFDATGKPARLIGTVQDVTDRRRTEAERLAMARRLLHTQNMESLGVIAGGVAHNFNNILGVISGNLELSMLNRDLDSPVRVKIETAMQACARATDLTRQMLAYCGKQISVFKEIDLNRVIRRNADHLNLSVDGCVMLEIVTAPGLPLIHASETQIQQVIMNLLVNASEAIGDRQGTITLSTGVARYDDGDLGCAWPEEKTTGGRFVYVEVSDTGCGMSEEAKRRLCEPFFTTKFFGRGLGMAAVQGIVRAHKGTILVKSSEGAGSTVRVLLPYKIESKTEGDQF